MFFDKVSYRIGSENYSLDDIAFGILLGNVIRPGVYRMPHDSPKIGQVISDARKGIFSVLSFGTLRSPKIQVYHASEFYREISRVTCQHLNTNTAFEADANRVNLEIKSDLCSS